MPVRQLGDSYQIRTERALFSRIRKGDPKTVIVVRKERVGRTVRRAAVARIVAPRTAAQQATVVLVAVGPSAAVLGSAAIAVMPVVGAPFPHVAVHVVHAKRIGRKNADVRSLVATFSLGLRFVGCFAVVVCEGPGEGMPEVKRRCRSRPTGVFPLGFGGQAIFAVSSLEQAIAELHGGRAKKLSRRDVFCL